MYNIKCQWTIYSFYVFFTTAVGNDANMIINLSSWRLQVCGHLIFYYPGSVVSVQFTIQANDTFLDVIMALL